MSLKQKVYEHFYQLVQSRIKHLKQKMEEFKIMGMQETKSTAGDKHETALAMIQIEQGHLRAQLSEALGQLASLEKINPLSSFNIIGNGSLVYTDSLIFFISTALGKAEIDERPIIAISSSSPIGLELLGLSAGQKISVNGREYDITKVE